MLTSMGHARVVVGALLGSVVLAVVACVGEDPQPTPASTDGGVAESGSSSSSSSSSSSGSSGDGGSVQVVCSGAQCGASEVCCALNAEKWSSAGCRPAGGCADRELACDGPEDCPKGQSCCAEIGATPPGLQGAHCATTCPKLANALCHTPADCGGNPCNAFDTAAGDFPTYAKRCAP